MTKDDQRLDRLEQRIQRDEESLREVRISLLVTQAELRGGRLALVWGSAIVIGLVGLAVGVTRIIQWMGGRGP